MNARYGEHGQRKREYAAELNVHVLSQGKVSSISRSDCMLEWNRMETESEIPSYI